LGVAGSLRKCAEIFAHQLAQSTVELAQIEKLFWINIGSASVALNGLI
jgi:hypothetical protein